MTIDKMRREELPRDRELQGTFHPLYAESRIGSSCIRGRDAFDKRKPFDLYQECFHLDRGLQGFPKTLNHQTLRVQDQ